MNYGTKTGRWSSKDDHLHSAVPSTSMSVAGVPLTSAYSFDFKREIHLPWWWLSFCDASLPEGSQFLGVVICQGNSLRAAMNAAWAHKANPGGEVEGYMIPKDMMDLLPDHLRNIRLNKEQAMEIDKTHWKGFSDDNS